ncbi:MAG: hypothetical protein K0S71_2497 [Clostridia bacterium]|nr:hypothetical protein [Clostridia bacterium]
MRVIAEHDEKESCYLTQYARNIENLSSTYKIIDIEEKYLPWLKEISRCIEPDFTICLCKEEEEISSTLLDSDNIILATIGVKLLNERIDSYYNIAEHTLHTNKVTRDVHKCQWINCYSDHNEIQAADYIKCICFLRDMSSKCHEPIVIYANINVPDETYRYRSLTDKIINNYLSDIEGVLITKSARDNIYKYYTPVQKSYEFYSNHILYFEDSLNDVFLKVVPFLYTSQGKCKFKSLYKFLRQRNTLYEDDFFYRGIEPDQEIYVPLNLGNFREPEDYEALGLEHIPLIGDYGMLYGKKSLFDELSEGLREEITYPYYMPILSQVGCNKRNIGEDFSYSLVPDNLKYKGKGTYIGMVVVDDIDYTNKALRTKDGKSRIACIWHQTRANEGIYYYQEQIDEALASEAPSQLIELPGESSMSTVMLGIAGGMSEEPDYKGVATEAEFIVAKVNIAPQVLQRLYGGIPSESAITMADALIGAIKLINFAREKGRPLALCIPFNSNIDPHDSSLILYQMLGLMAQRDSLTIIVPAGEEADKMHHFSVGGNQPASTTVNIRVQKENQNIVGIIYQKFTSIFKTVLYPPKEASIEPIDLKTAGVTRLKEASVYSNGYKISYLNGAIRILFRVENPQMGEWRIEITSNTEGLSQIDIWISQQELNEYITLSPASPFITVGSLGNTDNIMTVGGYDKESMVVLRSSGRGYSWDNRVKPLFITHASNITAPCSEEKWVTVSGTLPASSIMLGTAATLYCKYIEEQVFPLPNTLVMNSTILGAVKQLEGVEYPNPSQGYGIFDVQTLNTLLSSPFVL